MEPGRPGIQSPYEQLGIEEDAGFDAVQQAKTDKLATCGDDNQAKARIEAAYDAVLMDRLKQRQAGHLSNDAASASQQEAKATAAKQLKLPNLPRWPLRRSVSRPGNPSVVDVKAGFGWPTFSLAEGRLLWLPLAVHSGLLAWIFVVSHSQESLPLVLSLGTGMTILNLLWRSGRFLRSVLWGFAGLAIGLVFGSLLAEPLASGDAFQDLRSSTAIAITIQLILSISLA